MVVTAQFSGGRLLVASDTKLTDVLLSLFPRYYPAPPYYRSAPWMPRTIQLGYLDPGTLLQWTLSTNPATSDDAAIRKHPVHPDNGLLKTWVTDPLNECGLTAYSGTLRADWNTAALRLVYGGSS